jgi:hypothetical protein
VQSYFLLIAVDQEIDFGKLISTTGGTPRMLACSGATFTLYAIEMMSMPLWLPPTTVTPALVRTGGTPAVGGRTEPT